MTMSDNTKISIRDYLKKKKLLCDGAFGTYYSAKHDTQELPEKGNITAPERVKAIHMEYVQAGARLVRTNTFASNTVSLKTGFNTVTRNIREACRLAYDATAGRAYVAGDIGPIPYENADEQDKAIEEYIKICDTFMDCRVPVIVFETFSNLDDILPAIRHVREKSDMFIIVQFTVSQFGYSSVGLSARRLIKDALSVHEIDAVGFNCGVGPGHMYKVMSELDIVTDKYLTALPNAGYPQNISNRMIFASDNAEYFMDKMKDLSSIGIDIIGGCCGTTPEYIQLINENDSILKKNEHALAGGMNKLVSNIKDNSFYNKLNAGKGGTRGILHDKLIAVELAPPIGSDDNKLMEAAHMLDADRVDVITFPDSPSGRTRADSILMAEKVARETNICVMPHLCCRDKNAIAVRSQILGAHINDINNFLVITGDPIPSMMRQSIKSVFNFDSVGLMNIISDMNEDQFEGSHMVFGGAINQNRKNLTVEIGRVHKKMKAGASFFLTQPVFTQEGAGLLRRIKEETGARILCGIMPFVSRRNAMFMKNEMAGIDVTDEIIERYDESASRDEGEQVGVQIAREVIDMTKDFVDGYYFSFPFNRVYMLDDIIK